MATDKRNKSRINKILKVVENLPEKVQEDLVNLADNKTGRYSKIEQFLYEKPVIKVSLALFSYILIRLLTLYIPFSISVNLNSILGIMMTAYVAGFVLFLLKRSYRSLNSAHNVIGIFMSYIIFIIALTSIFSFTYYQVEKMEAGYLTYGECSDTFDKSMISQDGRISHNYFYFSVITFFTIGYGDICPMGYAKYLSLINGFIGNFVTVVLMVVVISSYLNRSKFEGH